MVWISLGSDGESSVDSFVNDPDVSFFVMVGVGSDIKIITEFSVIIVWAEDIVIWVCATSNVIVVSLKVDENDLVSVFLLINNKSLLLSREE